MSIHVRDDLVFNPQGGKLGAAANISARDQPELFEYGHPDLSFGLGTATLAATPEPASLGLLIAALGGLFAVRRGNVH